MGSNLTVYCHLKTCQPSSTIFLELSSKTVKDRSEINCTTVQFHLPNVQESQSFVVCKLDEGHSIKTVSGQDLQGGRPPDKPQKLNCHLTRSSDFIYCSWMSGSQTYISTTYNSSISSDNGTCVYSNHIQDAEEIKIPRRTLDENTKYEFTITAYNYFGVSRSNPFILCVKDIVIPDTPYITHIGFKNTFVAVDLQWNTTDYSAHLRPSVRLRVPNGSWEVREETELNDTLIRVDNLKPLTDYEFQLRTCNSTSRLKHITEADFTPSSRSLCSKWSPSVMGRSPGKGPSKPLVVWRTVDSFQNVTVLWKPPPPQDYSGDVYQYRVFLSRNDMEDVVCPASSRSLPVPAEVHSVSISAVTLYGSSPPANVPLGHSGDLGPVLRDPTPFANGIAVRVSWFGPRTKNWSTSGELLQYVLEWTSVPETEPQWQEVDKNEDNTLITGLTAGVRYKISLYAVTTGGVSSPSSTLVYSKEQKPASGPDLSVLGHENKMIKILWEKLPVNQQRGFIRNYTLYIQALDTGDKELRVMLPAFPKQMWVECPEGTLSLQMTASTLAGEGPRSNRIVSQPAAGLVIEVVVTITFCITIIVSLICCRCIRKRIKQRCLSWGPAWLSHTLPKPGNSNAIRLLQQDRCEPCFGSIDSDPLLSPITLLSWEEREAMYPIIHVHVQVSQKRLEQGSVKMPVLATETGTVPVVGELHHASYKPHIGELASQVDKEEEEQKDVAACVKEEVCPSAFGGLLSSVEVDCPAVPKGTDISSVSDGSWPRPSHTTAVSKINFCEGTMETQSHGEVNDPPVKFHHADMTMADMADTCLSQRTVETLLAKGYFPQIPVSSSALCVTQR
uniref:Interleukin-12 receptor subunit beta-2-like n=2 Tax=Cynoglossus semilaevis TaxID=244447 RepID=A0A3P8VB39_CYNSE